MKHYLFENFGGYPKVPGVGEGEMEMEVQGEEDEGHQTWDDHQDEI